MSKFVAIYTVTVFCTFFIQSLTAAAKANPPDPREDAESSLNMIREEVIDGISDAFKRAYAAMSQTVDSTATSVISDTSATILARGEEFVSKYETLTQAALDAELDITICIESFEDRFRNLASENIQQLENCVIRESGSSIDYISSGVSSLVRDYFDLYVYAYEKAILSCVQAEDCLNGIISEIGEASGSLSDKINNSVDEHVNGLDEYLEAIANCGDFYIAATNGVGEGMLAGLELCLSVEENE